ncbi:acyltransferase [Hyphomonas sp.]|uniref:acyltransferase family protein n=1 Tax=Hyphomonas sp. TaxID=87 RepID=UPI0033408D29
MTQATEVSATGASPGQAASATTAASVWSGHIPALDGIRGLGVILVLFFHYGSSTMALGVGTSVLQATGIGWSGVDLFFVLSGFLITGLLYDAKGKPHYFKNFYARRTLRIFPLYYFAAVVVIILAVITGYGILGGSNPIWVLLYVGNFQMAIEGGGSILDHFWSLAIEEQFYLLWPMIVLSLSRGKLMLVAAAMIVISPLVRTLLVLNDALELAVYVLTPARMDGLAFGALIALLVRGPKGIAPLVPWAWRLGVTSAAAFLVIVIARRDFSTSDPVILTAGISLLTIMYASLLVLSLSFRPLQLVMELPVMRWFGKYSYGLYVWHPIVNIILLHSPLTEQIGADTLLEVVALVVFAFIASILVTLASYRFLEAPLLRLKSRFQ